MNRTAVIGGAGFIGSRLVPSLENAFVVDRSAPEDDDQAHRIDVRDREAVIDALEGVDTVYLLAGVHTDDVDPPSLYFDVNVGGADNVIAAAEHHDIRRMIFSSTMAVYGLDAVGATEDTPPNPFNAYARSKLEAEQRVVQWAGAGEDRSLVIVRPCVVFGEGNRGNVHTLLRQIRSRRFVMVGQGKNRKSMAYVGNLVEFLKEFQSAPPGIHTYNYADEPAMDMAQLVGIAADELGVSLPRISLPYPVGLGAGYLCDAVARVTGRKLPVSSIRVRKFLAETTLDTRRLSSTGFVPPFTLEEGLRRTIRADFLEAEGARERPKAQEASAPRYAKPA